MKKLALLPAFLLVIAAHSQSLNDSCYQAIELFCGDILSVDYTGHTPDAGAIGSCTHSSNQKSAWYKFTGTGDIVFFSLCNYTAEVLILDGDCGELQCIDNTMSFYRYLCGDYSDEKAFRSEAGKTYYIYCNTVNPQLQSTLTVTCFPPAENNRCETATSIELNETYSYSLLNAYPSGHPATHYQFEYSLGDLWYAFTGTGEYLMINDFSSYYLLSPMILKGDCNNYEVITATYYNGNPTYPTEAGATYLMRIIGSYTDTRQFSLQPVPVADNDQCSGARPYVLGDTLILTVDSTLYNQRECYSPGYNAYDRWYQFTGIDTLITITANPYFNSFDDLRHLVLSGDCDNLICEDITRYDKTISFWGEAGKTYWLNISYSHYPPLPYPITVSSVVHPPVINDEYTGALPLSCKDTLIGSMKYALVDKDISDPPVPRLWYQVVGTGEYYSVYSHFTNYPGSYDLSASFYTLEGGQLTFLSTAHSKNYVFLEKDKLYYLSLYNDYYAKSTFPIRDTFEVALSCTPILANDSCEEAFVVALNDTITSSTAFSYLNPADACTPSSYSDGWYQFTGDGHLKDLTFIRANSAQHFSLSKGSCEARECVSFLQRTLNDNTLTSRFLLEEGVTYYLKVYNTSSSSNFKELPFTFYFQDLPITENDVCSTANELTCSSIVQDSLDFALPGDPLCAGQLSTDRGVWYHIAGDGRYYELNFPQLSQSNFENLVDATLFQGNCEQLQCIEGELKTYIKKFVFLAENGKDYYLLLQKLTDLSFSVNCFDVGDNNLYTKATEINCDKRYTGYYFDPTYTSVKTCQPDAPEIIDMWFKVQGQDELLYFSIGAGTSIGLTDVFMLENGELQCFGQFKDQGRIFLPAGKTYYLPMHLINTAPLIKNYDYDLSFSCHPPAGNDDCATAFELLCGESISVDNDHATNDLDVVPCGGTVPGIRPVWFRIEGDDSWKDLDIQSPDGSPVIAQIWAYEGSCDQLSCLYQDQIFFAKAGKTYFVNINGRIGPMTVSLSCPDQAVNDLCHDAILVNCGDTVRASLDYAMLCDYGDNCPNSSADKKIWYEILGQGELIHMQLFPAAYNEHSADIQIYAGDCCTLPPVENLYGDLHNKYFLAEAGKKYLIAVKLGAVNDDGYFELILDCADPADFSICENALDVDDQQLHQIDPNKQLPFPPINKFQPDPASWLYFTGSGGDDTLLLSNQGQVAFIPHVLIDTDNNCSLTSDLFTPLRQLYRQGDSSAYTIRTVAGLRYMILLQGQPIQNTDHLNVRYKKGEMPTPCSMTLPLKLTAPYQGNVQIPVSIVGDNGPFIITITSKAGSSQRKANVPNNSTITYWPESSGYIFINYYSDQCQGHALSSISLENVPAEDCPVESLSCLKSIELSEPLSFSHIFDAAQLIKASSEIEPGVEVLLRAGTQIQLLPGFHAKAGSQVSMTIQPCNLPSLEQENPPISSTLETLPITIPPTDIGKAALQVFPNPLSNTATIRFQLIQASYYHLFVYDMRGNLMTQLLNAEVAAGPFETTLHTDDLPAGMYYLVLRTKAGTVSKAISVVR